MLFPACTDRLFILLLVGFGISRAAAASQEACRDRNNSALVDELSDIPHIGLLQHGKANLKHKGVWTVTLPSGQEHRGLDDVFYHVHIPKVAGISFSQDALELLTARGLRFISREGCFARPGLPDPQPRDRLVMIRNPAAHVLSQFNFCKYAYGPRSYIQEVTPPSDAPLPQLFQDWVRAWAKLKSQGWSCNCTPSADRVHPFGLVEVSTRKHRIDAWSKPPWALPNDEMLQEASWPELDGGGTIWHFVKAPFSSYVPIDFQSQRMTCKHAMEYPEKIDMGTAFENLDQAFHIGVVEAYQSSLCILYAKIDDKLPPYCDCRDAAKWQTFSGHHDNSGDEAEATDAMKIKSIKDLPQELQTLVDGLTYRDQQLYDRAWARLVREARWVEARHGVKVLCDEVQPPRY